MVKKEASLKALKSKREVTGFNLSQKPLKKKKKKT